MKAPNAEQFAAPSVTYYNCTVRHAYWVSCFAALLLSIAGCSGEQYVDLSVYLVTDYEPVREFFGVRTVVAGREFPSLARVEGDYPGEGELIAVYENLTPSSVREVTVALIGPNLFAPVKESFRIEHDKDLLVWLSISRDCAGVSCEDVGADLRCLGARCVSEKCIRGNEPECEPECQNDDECVPESECGVGICNYGVCLETAIGSTKCAPHEVCTVSAGCVPKPTPCLTVAECAQPKTCGAVSCHDGQCIYGLAASGTPCDGGTCDAGQCVSCDDGIKNGSEANIDCGGTLCTGCLDNQSCILPTDCLGGICRDNRCQTDICGNNMVAGSEACDDGNQDNGDGCSATCLLENGANCQNGSQCDSGVCDTAVSGQCRPALSCGNGVREGIEACDDGGNAPGDGCNPDCLLENGVACSTSGQCGSEFCSDVCLATQSTYFKAELVEAHDRFATSIALNGDLMAIGAHGDDSCAAGVNGDETDNGCSAAGAVHVYRQENGTWKKEAYIKPSNPDAGDYFGFSLDLDENTLVVGAYREDSCAKQIDSMQDDNGCTESGAAYVFRRSGTTWTQEAYLKPSNSGKDDLFGRALSVSKDRVVVGAHGEDSCATGIDGDQVDNNCSAAGAVYVFEKQSGMWSQTAYVKASNAEANDVFGYALEIDRDTIVVGAARYYSARISHWGGTPIRPFITYSYGGEDSCTDGVNAAQDSNGCSAAGAAYAFFHDGTSWNQQAYFKANASTDEHEFGASVSISGDTIAVGAPNGTNGPRWGTEGVFIYRRSGTVWRYEDSLKANNTKIGYYFGSTVQLHGDHLVVGDKFDADCQDGWMRSRSTIGNDNCIEHNVVGPPVYSAQPGWKIAAAGAAYVFKRQGTQWLDEAFLKASTSEGPDNFGASVALGDGVVMIGAPTESSCATGKNGDETNNDCVNAGAVYLWSP